MVQFGIFDHIEGISGTDTGKLLRDRIELVQIADRAGFYGYHLAEHHGSDLCMAPSQEIFLAAAAQVTSQIRLGPLVKCLPLHHPLRVVEEICLLDHLTGGRVDYGFGRGIAAVEHYWFGSDWFASHERFEEALAVIIGGLQTGKVDGTNNKYFRFPQMTFSLRPAQTPNPPMWAPGNPVTAGRYGFGLVWPGPVPPEAYDLYLASWEAHRDDPIRACTPDATPRVGVSLIVGIGDTEAEGKAIAAGGVRGLMRRILAVHALDRLVLDEQQAEAALNPLARHAQALLAPGGERELMPLMTGFAGTVGQVTEAVQSLLDDGRTDYVILQLPTGDMTFEQSRDTLERFIEEVIPAL